VSFDHAASAGFRLLGKHQQLKCEGCHVNNLTDALRDQLQAMGYVVQDTPDGTRIRRA
jgi:cysteinyl-tRNA synthetase